METPLLKKIFDRLIVDDLNLSSHLGFIRSRANFKSFEYWQLKARPDERGIPSSIVYLLNNHPSRYWKDDLTLRDYADFHNFLREEYFRSVSRRKR